jgi:hypothetical protein
MSDKHLMSDVLRRMYRDVRLSMDGQVHAPIEAFKEAADELDRQHAEIAALRARVAELDALHAACVAAEEESK